MLVCIGGREKRSSSLFIHLLKWVWRKVFFFSHEFLSQLREYIRYLAFLDLIFPSKWFFDFFSSYNTNFLFLLRNFFVLLLCDISRWFSFDPLDIVLNRIDKLMDIIVNSVWKCNFFCHTIRPPLDLTSFTMHDTSISTIEWKLKRRGFCGYFISRLLYQGIYFFLWLFCSDYPSILRADFWPLLLTTYYFRYLLSR